MKRSIVTTTIAAAVVGIGLTSTAFADGPWGRRQGDGRHSLVHSIIMGVIVAAIVGLVVYLVAKRSKASAPSAPVASPTASAEAILAERLARSEISPDDYRSLLAALKAEPVPASSPEE